MAIGVIVVLVLAVVGYFFMNSDARFSPASSADIFSEKYITDNYNLIQRGDVVSVTDGLGVKKSSVTLDLVPKRNKITGKTIVEGIDDGGIIPTAAQMTITCNGACSSGCQVSDGCIPRNSGGSWRCTACFCDSNPFSGSCSAIACSCGKSVSVSIPT